MPASGGWGSGSPSWQYPLTSGSDDDNLGASIAGSSDDWLIVRSVLVYSVSAQENRPSALDADNQRSGLAYVTINTNTKHFEENETESRIRVQQNDWARLF